MKSQTKISPSLSRRVKSALALRGMHLKDWAKERGYPVSTVSMVMHGNRVSGPVAKEIIRKLRRVAA